MIIDHIGIAVSDYVVRVVNLSDSRRSIVGAPGRERGCMKCSHLIARASDEGDVHRALLLAAGAEPEFRLACLSEPPPPLHFRD